MVKISKIVIELDGKTIEVSEDEDRKLHQKLDEFFSKPINFNPPIVIEKPYIRPTYPRIWYQSNTTDNTSYEA